MNVLLLCPKTPTTSALPALPLGALAIASYLKEKGYSVKIADFTVSKRSLAYYLKDFKPDVVGVTLMSLLGIPHSQKLSAHFRQLGIPVIWGGNIPSCLPEEILREGAADYVVIREGESVFHELLQRIEKGESAHDVGGIAYLDNDDKLQMPPREQMFEDLHSLPPLDFSFVNPRNYYQHYPSCSKGMYLYSSKGCGGVCAFCFNPHFNKSVHRPRNIEHVCHEIRILVNEYDVDGIFFCDADFCGDKQELFNKCAKLKALNLPFVWGCQTRIGITKEELTAMYDAGCRWVMFGVETGSERLQAKINKNLDLATVHKPFEYCRELGITTIAGIILGLPTETQQDLRDSISAAFRMKSHITACQFYCAFQHTQFFDELVESGLLKEPKTLKQWLGFFALESGKITMGNVPNKELRVVQKFFLFASAVLPQPHTSGRFFLFRRYIVDTLRFMKLKGFFNGIAFAAALGTEAVKMLWYITMYPKIRKKYGLYLRNFKQQ